MKGILEFDLNDSDDIMSHLRCVKSTDLALALWDIYYNLPKRIETTFELTETEESKDRDHQIMEILNNFIQNSLTNRGIILDDIIN